MLAPFIVRASGRSPDLTGAFQDFSRPHGRMTRNDAGPGRLRARACLHVHPTRGAALWPSRGHLGSRVARQMPGISRQVHPSSMNFGLVLRGAAQCGRLAVAGRNECRARGDCSCAGLEGWSGHLALGHEACCHALRRLSKVATADRGRIQRLAPPGLGLVGPPCE